jgi:hypothetical protein
MTLRVTFSNTGGVLDFRDVEGTDEARDAAIEMIEEAGDLHDGDTIRVTDLDPS